MQAVRAAHSLTPATSRNKLTPAGMPGICMHLTSTRFPGADHAACRSQAEFLIILLAVSMPGILLVPCTETTHLVQAVRAASGSASHPDRLRGPEQAAGARGLHLPHAAWGAQGAALMLMWMLTVLVIMVVVVVVVVPVETNCRLEPDF